MPSIRTAALAALVLAAVATGQPPGPTSATPAPSSASLTSAAPSSSFLTSLVPSSASSLSGATLVPVPSASTTDVPNPNTSPPAQTTSPTQSPLLFFVALGFGVVFTNLWIIVGVKYCFRYNARNRALAAARDANGEPINLDTMGPQPRRRRREKKLMSMEEVNERFPLTKYKTWTASRARAGLSTEGGVDAAQAAATAGSRAASVRDVDGAVPQSPSEAKTSLEMNRSVTPKGKDASTDVAEVLPTPSPAPDGADRRLSTESAKEKSTLPQSSTMPTLHEVATNATAHTADTTELKEYFNPHAPRSPTSDRHRDDHDHSDSDDEGHDGIHPYTGANPDAALVDHPGDSCAICIDALEDDDDIRGLTCGHAFHASCIDPWLTSRRACCPLCKADYFTPKPRPEGEAADSAAEGGRRRAAHPVPPGRVWMGRLAQGRDDGPGTRIYLPGRFMSTPVVIRGHQGAADPNADAYRGYRPEESRRVRRQREEMERRQREQEGGGSEGPTTAWTRFSRGLPRWGRSRDEAESRNVLGNRALTPAELEAQAARTG